MSDPKLRLGGPETHSFQEARELDLRIALYAFVDLPLFDAQGERFGVEGSVG